MPVLTNPDLESLIIYITYQRHVPAFFIRSGPALLAASQNSNIYTSCNTLAFAFQLPLRPAGLSVVIFLFFLSICSFFILHLYATHGWVARLSQVTLDAHSSSSIGVLASAIVSLRPSNPAGPEFSSPARVSVQHRANRTYGC